MDHVTPIIAGLTGLLGVALGGWIPARNQRKQRLHEHIEKQLHDFYSPLLLFRSRITFWRTTPATIRS
jgi:hypothetical protein